MLFTRTTEARFWIYLAGAATRVPGSTYVRPRDRPRQRQHERERERERERGRVAPSPADDVPPSSTMIATAGGRGRGENG